MSLTYDVLKDDVRARRPIDFGFVTYVPERTCRMEAFLLGEFFTGNKHVTGTDMSDEEFVALLKELEEDTIIRCSSCHFSIPSGADVQYTQTDEGAWAVEATGTRIKYCPHCGARVVEEEA